MEDSGFLHLNIAGQWPSFTFSPADLSIGSDGALRLVATSGGFVPRGVLLGGPFEVPGVTQWFRVVAQAAIPLDTHVQFFTYTSNGVAPPFDPLSDSPFTDSGWREAPRDELDILILNPPASQLWIGGLVRSEGTATPALYQARIESGRDTYLKYLPPLYAENETARDFLERLLALDESVLGGVEREITDLTTLFDPAAAPASDFPSWLSWLSSWLAFDLNERWAEPDTRRYIAEAFKLYSKRGTIEGLRRYLKIYAGVEAHITEPGRNAALWSLGESSTLGFTTRLAPGPLGGAVLDSTAALDGSHLDGEQLRGAALFDDVAHKFCVNIYCADLSRPGAFADARAVLDREKPAHTVYHLCAIQPRMRVGAQALVGINAIVGQAPGAQLGIALDTGVLFDAAAPCKEEEVLNGTDRRRR